MQVGDQFFAAGLVQRGQGFIEQQHGRLREQGTANRHALRFATRQVAWVPRQQRSNTQQLHHGIETEACLAACAVAAVEQIATYLQVREQACVLEHVTHVALVHGKVDALRAVEQAAAIHLDAPGHRRHQAGDGVEHGGLAGAGGAHQRDHARFVFNAHMAMEGATPQFDIDPQHQPSSSACREWWRRTSHSENSSAASEIATATAASRQMPASPSGTCISP